MHPLKIRRKTSHLKTVTSAWGYSYQCQHTDYGQLWYRGWQLPSTPTGISSIG